MRDIQKSTIKKAFNYTLPIMTGFMFLGIAYGVYMRANGFSALYPILMSITVFAGSMEFVTAGLLLGAFDPFGALTLTLMVNARHLFYGLSMLGRYTGSGIKKWYMVFGLCDETFSINCTASAEDGIDHNNFMFYVTLFDHLYWVSGATLGALFGSFLSFNTEGLDFVMTALFLVIFVESLIKENNHTSSAAGVAITLICLLVFGKDSFMIPAMIAILGFLTVMRGTLQGKEGKIV